MTNQLPTRPTSREPIYEIIDGEREYQEKTHPDSPAPTITEFAALIDQYAVALATPFVPASPAQPDLTVDQLAARGRVALKRFREIAAIAVHAMEIYGAAPRDNHVPASAGITGTLRVTTSGDALAKVPSGNHVNGPVAPGRHSSR